MMMEKPSSPIGFFETLEMHKIKFENPNLNTKICNIVDLLNQCQLFICPDNASNDMAIIRFKSISVQPVSRVC